MPYFICLRWDPLCIFSRCLMNRYWSSRSRSSISLLAESEKIISITTVLPLDDLLYILKRIGFALFGLDIFHLYLDRFVYQDQFFLLDHPLVGKDGLAYDLSLASRIALLNDALYGGLIRRAQIDIHGPSLNVCLMSIKAYKHCSSTNNLNLSFLTAGGPCRAWAWRARSSRRLGYRDNSVCLVLDGGWLLQATCPVGPGEQTRCIRSK